LFENKLTNDFNQLVMKARPTAAGAEIAEASQREEEKKEKE
jgi:hypothetical protein